MEEEVLKQYIGETFWLKMKVKIVGVEVTRVVEKEDE
jgi:hypothetical protein